MTDANRVSDLDLLAYADGLLDDDPRRKAEVEAALATDPEAMARAEAYRGQTEALRAAYAWRLSEPVPARLTAALEPRPVWRGATGLRAAAAVLLTAGAGAAGWMLGQGDGVGDRAAALLAERSYASYVADHPGEAEPAMDAAIGESQPLGWLGEEVSIRLKAPDLTGAGYMLADKEAVTVDGQQIVRLDYAADTGSGGRGFSLFLAPRWETRGEGIAQAERDGVSMAYWMDGPLASTVVSQMPAEETRRLAEAVRKAMSAGGADAPVLEPKPPAPTAKDPGLVADSLNGAALDAPPQVLRTRERSPAQAN